MRFIILLVCLVMAGSLALGPAPARAAEGSVICPATGSVRLYTDLSKTTLVDAFSFANALTKHRIGSGDFVIQGDEVGPGVDVVGVVTGTPYVFRVPDGVPQHCFEPRRHRDPTLVGLSWRVMAPGAGVVSDGRSQLVSIYRDNVEVVYPIVDDGLPNGESHLLLVGQHQHLSRSL